MTLSGTSFFDIQRQPSPLSCAECASSVTTSSSEVQQERNTLQNKLPASSLEKSRTSLMMAWDYRGTLNGRQVIALGGVVGLSVRRVKPMTPLSGVRSS